jgi:alpha-methylacyl-CoA racemase
VLSPAEAAGHPHNVARRVFVDVGGFSQPAPAPRFSRTPAAPVAPPAKPGEHTDAALADWGFTPEEIAALRTEGVVS